MGELTQKPCETLKRNVNRRSSPVARGIGFGSKANGLLLSGLLLCLVVSIVSGKPSSPAAPGPAEDPSTSSAPVDGPDDQQGGILKEGDVKDESLVVQEVALGGSKDSDAVKGPDVLPAPSSSSNPAAVLQDPAGKEGKRILSVAELRAYIDNYAEESRKRSNKASHAAWAYATNITEENKAKKVNETLAISAWERAEWKENISKFDLSVLGTDECNSELRRLYDQVKVLGMAALDDARMEERAKLIADMSAIYSDAKICPYEAKSCDLEKEGWSLEPELTEILRSSSKKEDYDKLAYVWEKWRDASGRQIRQKFIDYVKLSNQGALANNDPKIKNAGDLWLMPYEDDNFPAEVEKLWLQLKPFYQEIHAFVRYKLAKHYGEDKIDLTEPIPAHLFGNMWAQNWDTLFPIVSEFPAASLDVTDEMRKQNYTVKRMFEVSDDFFTGMGLAGVKDAAIDFYEVSMLEKPTDGRKVVCHASAWDFMATNSLPGDFRIKMCTDITMKDLITIHHELGHIQYYMQYVDKSPLFRTGANPGFHEAIGDTLALSASTTKHLKSTGLLDEGFELDQNAQMAYLLRTALAKIAFLPFGYLVDLYRWRIFDGSIPFEKLNAEWWKLREGYQGIKPPVPRSEQDFDAGAKFHVAASTPYVRYFVAHVLQFTFHQSLCEAAGQYNPKDSASQPLHNCAIGGSTAAGAKLKKLLQAGNSMHWKEALFQMTGSREMSVEPMLNYFKPLRTYLQKYIADNEIPVGWLNAI